MGIVPATAQQATGHRQIERVDTRDQPRQRVSSQDRMCDGNGFDRDGGLMFMDDLKQASRLIGNHLSKSLISKHHGNGGRLPSRVAEWLSDFVMRNTRALYVYTSQPLSVVVVRLFVDCSATGSAPLLLESADNHSAVAVDHSSLSIRQISAVVRPSRRAPT
jgi:hypothetical protein